MRANGTLQRLFLPQTLAPGIRIALAERQAHYLLHVLRMKPGSEILVFNGRDGEWRAECLEAGRKSITLHIISQERPQPRAPDLVYCFAPLKHARLDYMVQKAVEMGAGILQPVMTARTQVTRLNLERMKANAIEAAEQCGILSIPECRPPMPFDALLAAWDPGRCLIFCDETAQGHNPVPLLSQLECKALGLIVGPEGGFTDDERRALKAHGFVTAIPLGPRILRADTAAVTALAVINATLGDWI